MKFSLSIVISISPELLVLKAFPKYLYSFKCACTSLMFLRQSIWNGCYIESLQRLLLFVSPHTYRRLFGLVSLSRAGVKHGSPFSFVIGVRWFEVRGPYVAGNPDRARGRRFLAMKIRSVISNPGYAIRGGGRRLIAPIARTNYCLYARLARSTT